MRTDATHLIELAHDLLRWVGMAPEPVQPSRLAAAAGFSVLTVDAPVLVDLLLEQKQIVVSASLSLRQREGAVALIFARAMLMRRGIPADAQDVDCFARALCMPPAQFAADWRASAGCYDSLAREYLFIPIEWLCEAIEALEIAPAAKLMHLQLVSG